MTEEPKSQPTPFMLSEFGLERNADVRFQEVRSLERIVW
jgi:hypothetical protein